MVCALGVALPPGPSSSSVHGLMGVAEPVWLKLQSAGTVGCVSWTIVRRASTVLLNVHVTFSPAVRVIEAVRVPRFTLSLGLQPNPDKAQPGVSASVTE